ncbi:hypothetical protein BSKO_07881 [Bryopsis sp. KO-2023]|nr:hypothetical protein BSKO_07881 [Bryopsis sp. KO-2023]
MMLPIPPKCALGRDTNLTNGGRGVVKRCGIVSRHPRVLHSNRCIRLLAYDGSDILEGNLIWDCVVPLAGSAAVPWAIKRLWDNVLKPQKCAGCLGVGSVLCPKCLARGKVGGVFNDDVAEECRRCRGCGRLPCIQCNGTGVQNSWLWKPKDDRGWGPRGNEF